MPTFENCRNIHFLGENKENTIIRLTDNCQGFEKGKQKPLVSFVNNEMEVTRNEEYTNVAFMNCIEDITLDCGKGNPGAIGIKYVSSNCGRIENVNILTEDGVCGIYVSNSSSQAVLNKINISGFDYGIDSECTVMITLDKIDVSRNKIAGVYTNGSTMCCNSLVSEGVPAFKFKEGKTPWKGRYFFANTTYDNYIDFAEESFSIKKEGIPENIRSPRKEDWVCG